MNPIYEAVAKATADTGEPVRVGAQMFVREFLKKFPDTSPDVLTTAFYAGAGYIFSLQMFFLEPGEEPTMKDMERMSNMGLELERFDKVLRDLLK